MLPLKRKSQASTLTEKSSEQAKRIRTSKRTQRILFLCRAPVNSRGLAAGLLLSAEPKQAVENKAVLGFILERKGELFVGLMLVIDIIMPHIEIDHSIALVCPDHGIIALLPDFVCFRPGSERVTRWIN